MAQQTQVDRVVPRWRAFLDLWPTPRDCAAASLGDLLRFWEGLGYPRRARNLHACAVAVAEAGAFPESLDALMALPGVGPYTARAVLAFAFERDVAVVDTNAARVLARCGGRTLTPREVQAAADACVPPGQGWAWNQAMLDLGATVCTARSPQCARCPVISVCAYRGTGSDPAVGSAGVSGRQAPFAGSDRQLRGRILRLVAALPTAVAGLGVEVGVDQDRAHRLAHSLVDDGLLVLADGVLRLP